MIPEINGESISEKCSPQLGSVYTTETSLMAIMEKEEEKKRVIILAAEIVQRIFLQSHPRIGSKFIKMKLRNNVSKTVSCEQLIKKIGVNFMRHYLVLRNKWIEFKKESELWLKSRV